MKTVHIAEIKPGNGIERIIFASFEKKDMLKEVKKWRKHYPKKRISYKTILEDRRDD